MPANVANAKNLLFTTDYPIDKVVYKYQFTASVTHASTRGDKRTFTIPHGLPFTPYCIGSYSDDNWTTSFDFGNFDLWYNSTFREYGPRIAAVVQSDATNIYVLALNYDSTRTVDFHIVGLAPEGETVTAPPPVRSGDFNLNTDYNYMKIIDSGVLTTSGDQTWVVPHNLGYVPSALVFTRGYADMVYLQGAENVMGANDYESIAYLDENNLTLSITGNFGVTASMMYRIYADG